MGGAAVAMVRSLYGARALLAAARFLFDPIGAADVLNRRYDGAAALALPGRWRRDRPSFYFFAGSALNRAVYDRWEDLQPKNIWPVEGPRGSAQEALRRSYLRLTGAEHDGYAVHIAGTFRRTHVATYNDAISAIVSDELDRWPTDRATDLGTLCKDLAIRVTMSVLFGEHDRDRAIALGHLLDDFHLQNWSLAPRILRLTHPSTPYGRLLRSAEEVSATISEWAAEDAPGLRAAFKAAEVAVDPERESRLVANVATTAWAAFETPALALGWALLLLEQHPEIARALHQEVSGLPERYGLEDLNAMPLLEAVIFEALRVLPPAPFIGLHPVRETMIADIPVGPEATIVLSPWVTHRDAAVFAEAARFRPDRWFERRPTAYEFIAFSGGIRRCPGYHFSLLYLKIALAAFVRRYRVLLSAKVRYSYVVKPSLRPDRGGIPAILLKQDGVFSRTPLHGPLARLLSVEDRPVRAKRPSSARLHLGDTPDQEGSQVAAVSMSN